MYSLQEHIVADGDVESKLPSCWWRVDDHGRRSKLGSVHGEDTLSVSVDGTVQSLSCLQAIPSFTWELK